MRDATLEEKCIEIFMWIIQWSNDTKFWTNLARPYNSYEAAQKGLDFQKKNGAFECTYRLLKCEVLDD